MKHDETDAHRTSCLRRRGCLCGQLPQGHFTFGELKGPSAWRHESEATEGQSQGQAKSKASKSLHGRGA